MKVLLVNGSPHQEGNTNAALLEIARQLEKEGIGTEVLWLGMDAVSGCRSCYACINLEKCVINDCVNTFLDKAAEADVENYKNRIYAVSFRKTDVNFPAAWPCSPSETLPFRIKHTSTDR